ncbi:MAG TPA: GNAT family N-acetyltransferase [Pyrinomonadaceae bacterium]|nr:GNAT family N-acetyltransferase [Pyrinomonadaceae bacterium]
MPASESRRLSAMCGGEAALLRRLGIWSEMVGNEFTIPEFVRVSRSFPPFQQHLEDTRQLFREYSAWAETDLCFQNFEKELAELPGKYAEPDGCLLLVFHDTQLAGCVGLRKIDEGICEMKRLFVRDAFRGKGIGRGLIRAIILEATEIGYERMRLDTLPPQMNDAIAL